ncbi:hypothetical protein C6A86_016810 [Mycobacterium sp. ITM-2016-00316]|uniref:hypothetical protein n=1 Tax=Mycobacterium sp. ITM-2016-00316 TaxID=2099695 RepID=UPI00287FCF41|nr:hypothetical protein [Mycobacterium sp. ITM-2016-00316]WNG79930.1 hypothetical protein C6A86_016810 [Mycobacterium sp. ITM-2016-00316]
MSDDRPPIPDPMKREVRQRCGFGCVICGHPIYEYEHMDDYAVVKRHGVANITLLCDGHHRLKTGVSYRSIELELLTQIRTT